MIKKKVSMMKKMKVKKSNKKNPSLKIKSPKSLAGVASHLQTSIKKTHSRLSSLITSAWKTLSGLA